MTPFPRAFIIKDNANNGKDLSSCPFPDIACTHQEATSCINQETRGAVIAPRKTTFLFFCFLFN